MGSQFVDFNDDGHIDYLTATFDGSPHIAYGSADGFSKPERLLDADGERILISSYWDYDAEQHLTTDRAMDGENPPDERCISALAFDWDGDGDFDLLLGSYENGHLYRQMNEGDNEKPKFTGKNIQVMAGDGPFALPAKMTAPRLIDWDGDGDLDLIAGSFGDSYGQKEQGGGVYLSRNVGAEGKPEFGPIETLIQPSAKGATEPTRPDAGLYVDAVDWDGDGDLDLVVGGYSMWTPEPRPLTEDEEATVARLRQKEKLARDEMQALSRKISAEAVEATNGLESGTKEARAKISAVYAKYRDQSAPLGKKVQEITKELATLVPGPRRETFVWLYERQ